MRRNTRTTCNLQNTRTPPSNPISSHCLEELLAGGQDLKGKEQHSNPLLYS